MRRAWLCLALAGLGCDTPADAERYVLRWAFPAGATFDVRVRTHHRIGSDGDVPESLRRELEAGGTEATTVARLRLRVLGESAPGESELELSTLEYTFRGHVAHADVEMEYKGGEWRKDRVKTTGDTDASALKAFIEGIRRSVATPSKGRCRPQGLRAKTFRGSGAYAPLFHLFPTLPSHPVAVGDTWKEKAPLGMPGNPIVEELAAGVNKLLRIEDERFAVIETRLNHVVTHGSQQARFDRLRRARFDLRSGTFTQVVDELGIEMQGPTGGTITIHVQTEGQMTRR